MRRKVVMVGDRSGRRVVLAIDPSGTSRHKKVRVQCDCGSPEQVIKAVTFAETTSCKECSTRPYARKYGDRVANKTRLYNVWAGMKTRCKVKDSPWNVRWAGRGITVCDEWVNDFIAFEQWAFANSYEDGLTIDRINVNGNYEPSNCEWVTKSENSRRMRAGYLLVTRDRNHNNNIFNSVLSFGA